MIDVLFIAFALLAVASAFVAATAPRIVHAAFGLLGTFAGVAGLYALLGADFVALAQVIVYVGGILVLLVFGVLLTGRVQQSLGLDKEPRKLWPVLVGGVLLFGLLVAIYGTEWKSEAPEGEPAPTTARIGHAFLNVPVETPDPNAEGLTVEERIARDEVRKAAEQEARFLVPFELASVLLLAALIGAAYLARRRREAR